MSENQRFYCVKCEGSWSTMPEDNVCPRCKDEPIFDLESEEHRQFVDSLEEKAEQVSTSRFDTLFLFAGCIIGVLTGGTFCFFMAGFNEPYSVTQGRVEVGTYLFLGFTVGGIFVGRTLGPSIYRSITGREPTPKRSTRRARLMEDDEED